MCGIAGIVSNTLISKKDILSMTNALKHRGPDNVGCEIFNQDNKLNIALGQRRLSILDLSSAGHQPMSSNDDRYWIVFNGEIYNFQELRKTLTAMSYVFNSQTDTEVILNGFIEFGVEFFKKLNGMFALAIYDRQNDELVLARDRYGQKPLYYYFNGSQFLFASESKAIILHKDFKKELSMDSLSAYLQYEYLPLDLSIYKNVKKLLPGHYLVFKNYDYKIKQYFEISFSPYKQFNTLSEVELSKTLVMKLKKAVSSHMVSDVPVGVFLSGGIDSSIITALASELTGHKKLKTFSIGFDEKSFDESSYAEQVARLFKTDHHHETLSVSTLVNILPEIMESLDEPFADASIIPTYLLSKFTKQHVSVALGGDAGDELFAGYDPFLAHYWAEKYKIIPKYLSKYIIENLVNSVPVSEKNMSLDFKAKNFLKHVYKSPVMRNQLWIGSYDFDEQNRLFLAFNGNYPLNLIETPHDLSKENSLLWHYQKFYLAEDILTKVDRASMMNSLETRAPFLDNDFAEFANHLPYSVKFKGTTRKYILKKAFEGILPKSILYRQKKGFGIPLTKWIKQDLKNEISHYLSKEFVDKQSLFNYPYVYRLLHQHLKGVKDNRKQIWTLYVFQKWYEREFL
ncbi:MAG: asparagine synthase (glutamine-hydrolyzing) [Candidatus Cloacimonadales bacterium]|jgi:asparagine synthase (glutamine-hydrolysing)|nr:asparagine synthase (glutamine-hydrolyzing) [Candidatus Cloacimonadota bacterium]MDD2649667.1 asparagine synthase (glutamine-hydrolyzing) [Candidatus Cloacimonadota bacterium]MDX9976928.1 asparagine synthase (glutamine-hydrolyzing) [Candidatus Cloacimonadales bacterium]